MKSTWSPFPALLLLPFLAACAPVYVGDHSEPTPPGNVSSSDAASGAVPSTDAAAPLAPALLDASVGGDAAHALLDAGMPDASPSDASAGDASQLVDARASDAGIGCVCPLGTPCQSNTKLVGRPLCGAAPVPPIPPMPPAVCQSTTAGVQGYCGSYACRQTTSSFAAAFNPLGNCANARDFMCAGTMHAIAYQCMINNALVVKFSEETALCIKSDASVVAGHVGDACVGCFVAAYECCKNSEQCIAACVQGTSKACDDAQRAAGCLAPLVTCTGLPNLF